MIIGQTVTNPGLMRTRVTIKSRSITTQTGGFQTPAWVTVATVWARWTNVHGNEVWLAQTAQARQAAIILIRWRSDIDPTCAIERDGVLYEIVSMDNIQERGEYIELKVSRIAEG